jgi:hypothetical protein
VAAASASWPHFPPPASGLELVAAASATSASHSGAGRQPQLRARQLQHRVQLLAHARLPAQHAADQRVVQVQQVRALPALCRRLAAQQLQAADS